MRKIDKYHLSENLRSVFEEIQASLLNSALDRNHYRSKGSLSKPALTTRSFCSLHNKQKYFWIKANPVRVSSINCDWGLFYGPYTLQWIKEMVEKQLKRHVFVFDEPTSDTMKRSNRYFGISEGSTLYE